MDVGDWVPLVGLVGVLRVFFRRAVESHAPVVVVAVESADQDLARRVDDYRGGRADAPVQDLGHVVDARHRRVVVAALAIRRDGGRDDIHAKAVHRLDAGDVIHLRRVCACGVAEAEGLDAVEVEVVDERRAKLLRHEVADAHVVGNHLAEDPYLPVETDLPDDGAGRPAEVLADDDREILRKLKRLLRDVELGRPLGVDRASRLLRHPLVEDEPVYLLLRRPKLVAPVVEALVVVLDVLGRGKRGVLPLVVLVAHFVRLWIDDAEERRRLHEELPPFGTLLLLCIPPVRHVERVRVHQHAERRELYPVRVVLRRVAPESAHCVLYRAERHLRRFVHVYAGNLKAEQVVPRLRSVHCAEQVLYFHRVSVRGWNPKRAFQRRRHVHVEHGHAVAVEDVLTRLHRRGLQFVVGVSYHDPPCADHTVRHRRHPSRRDAIRLHPVHPRLAGPRRTADAPDPCGACVELYPCRGRPVAERLRHPPSPRSLCSAHPCRRSGSSA